MMSLCKRSVFISLLAFCMQNASAELVPSRGLVDSRVRVVAYNAEQVIRLRGYVGYQIHLQFAEGEQFVSIAAGDNKALDVGSEGNNFVLKPVAERIATNITLITTKRVYQFDYSSTTRKPDPARDDVIYSLRFIYPEEEAKKAAEVLERQRTEAKMKLAANTPGPERVKNMNYWGCGSTAIRPQRAYDDGVQTRLLFGARSEFPAMYVKNDDESESLLNFTVEPATGEVVIHRVARRLILRRGLLVSCLENRSFDGGGSRLDTGTLVPGVERRTKGVDNP